MESILKNKTMKGFASWLLSVVMIFGALNSFGTVAFAAGGEVSVSNLRINSLAADIATTSIASSGDTLVNFDYSTSSSYVGGGEIKIEIKNDTNPYFMPFDVSKIVLSPTTNFDPTITVTPSGDGLATTVTLKFAAGVSANIAGSVAFRLNFDASTWIRKVPNGTHILDVSAVAVYQGAEGVKLTKQMTTQTPDGSYTTNRKTAPLGDTMLNTDNIFNPIFYPRGLSFLPYEPGSELKFVFKYPAGAVVKASGVIYNSNQTAIDTEFTAAIVTGYQPGFDALVYSYTLGNPNTETSKDISIKGIKISFPSTVFKALDEVKTVTEIVYTLQGEGEKTSAGVDSEIVYKIGLSGQDMVDFNTSQINTERLVLSSEKADYNSRTMLSDRFSNAGNVPIPDTKYTIYNGYDSSGTETSEKLEFASIEVDQPLTTKFNMRYVIYVKDYNQATSSYTVNEINGYYYDISSKYIIPLPALGEGDYIDKVELIPLTVVPEAESTIVLKKGTGKIYCVDALRVSADFNVNLQFKTNSSLKFPNGTAIQHGSRVPFRGILTWNDTNEVGRNIGDPDYKNQILSGSGYTSYVYYADQQAHEALANFDKANKYPGDAVNLNLSFYNRNSDYKNIYLYNPANPWVNPTIYFTLPDCILPITEQAKLDEIVSNSSFGSGSYIHTPADGNSIVELTSAYNPELGTVVYTCKLNYIMTTSGITRILLRLPLQIKAGAAVNTYGSRNLTDAGIADTKAVYSVLAFEKPEVSIIPATDDPMQNTLTSKLTNTFGITTTSLYGTPAVGAELKVLSSKATSASASLYDETTDKWLRSDAEGAKTTVKLGDDGQFKLYLSNEGNTKVTGATVYNILPYVSNKSIDGTALNSEWTPTLKSLTYRIYDINTDVDRIPAGTTTGLVLSTATNPFNYNATTNLATLFAAFNTNVTTDVNLAKAFALTGISLNAGEALEILGDFSVPLAISGADVGKTAYNSAYFSGNNGAVFSAIPTKQSLVVTDNNSATISGNIWADYNKDGIKDATEPGVPTGFTINLYKTTDRSTAFKTATTDNFGNYQFSNLQGGDYFIQVVEKADGFEDLTSLTVNTSDSSIDPTTGVSADFTVTAATSNTVKNAGFIRDGVVTVQFNSTDALDTIEDVTFDGILFDGTVGGTAGRAASSITFADAATKAAFGDYIVSAATSKAYDINWNNPKATVVFDISRIKHTVTFDLNGTGNASDLPPVQNISHNTLATAPTNPSDVAPYSFIEWRLVDGTEEGATFDFASALITQDITLKAKWDLADGYNWVTFFMNDGTADVHAKIAGNADGLFGGMPADPTRIGYEFVGWNTNATAVDANFTAANATDSITADTDLYAVWERIEYVVTFDANYPTSSVITDLGDWTDGIETYQTTVDFVNSGVTLPAQPTLEFYNFAGWYLKDGTTTFDETAAIADDITVYAHYTRFYTATYVADDAGVTGDIPTDPTEYEQGGTVTVLAQSTLTRTGFVFKGWQQKNAAGTLEGTIYKLGSASESFTISENTTLHAVWTPLYTVTYDANGGEGDLPAVVTEYEDGTSVNVLGNSGEVPLTKDKHILSGWEYTNLQGGLTKVSFGDTIVLAFNVVLKAIWTEFFTVIFDLNGGVGTVLPDENKYLFNDEVATLPDGSGLTKSGFTFAGWQIQNADGSYSDITPPYTITADTTFYAKWNAIPIIPTYTVTYDSNGGEGIVPNDASQYEEGNSAYVLDFHEANALTKEGYTFKGWKSAELGNKLFVAGDLFEIPAQNVVFVAEWEKAPVKPTVEIYGNLTVNYVLADKTVVSSENPVVNKLIPEQGLTGTVTAKVPQGYRLVDSKTTTKDYALSVDVPNQTIEFVIEADVKADGWYRVDFVNSVNQTVVKQIEKNNLAYGKYEVAIGQGEFVIPAGYSFKAARSLATIAFELTKESPTKIITVELIPTEEVFMKRPTNLKVVPGGNAPYEITGVKNPFDQVLYNYTITDYVPLGLTFNQMALPSFTNAGNTTYDVIVTTTVGKYTVVENASAATAATIVTPTLADGENITMIQVVFDEVAIGFGATNKIMLDFTVWANPPSNEIVNRAGLSYAYDNGGTTPGGGTTTGGGTTGGNGDLVPPTNVIETIADEVPLGVADISDNQTSLGSIDTPTKTTSPSTSTTGSVDKTDVITDETPLMKANPETMDNQSSKTLGFAVIALALGTLLSIVRKKREQN